MAGAANFVTSFLVERVSGSARVGWSKWRDRGEGSPLLPSGAHAGVEITWALRGGAEYRIGSRTVVARRDAVVVVPEGVEHRTRLLPGSVALSLKVDAELVASVLHDLGRSKLEPGTMPCSALVGSLGAVLAERQDRPGRRSAATVDDLAEAIVRRLLEPEGTPAEGTDPRLRRAVDLIESRLSDPLEIDDLAKAAGMSRFHFGRSFRAALGASPYQWVLQRRVERAAALLRSGRWSVTDAAFEVGFSDLSRFSQAFRRHLGCPPSSFGPVS